MTNEICKVRNCLAFATHRAVIVCDVWNVPGAPPVVIELPLVVCKEHVSGEVAKACMDKDNWAVLCEVFEEQKLRKPEPRQVRVEFARLPVEEEEKPQSKLIVLPGGRS